MANSRLGNTKHRVSPQIDYNFDDIESDDDWIVEDQDPHGLDDHDPNEEEGNLNDLDILEFLSGGGDEEHDIDFDSDDLN